MGMLTSFIIRKSIVQRSHPGTFMALAMQNPRTIFILRCVMK